MKPPETFRRTFLERTTKCMRLAQLEHEAGVSGPEARVGHAFHAIAAAVGMATVLRGDERPTQQMADAVADRILSHPEEGWDLTQAMYEDVVDLVRRWVPHARFAADEQFERKYRTELDGTTLTGTIDRLRIVGDQAMVKDYKTGQGKPLDPPTVQGDVYSWHIFMHHPEVEVVRYKEEWTRFGIPTQPFDYYRDEVLDSVTRWLRTRLRVIRAAYEQPRLPTKPGGWCAHCPAPTTCSHPEWVRAESVIRTVDDATAQMEALIVEKARVAHRTKVVRAFLEGTGQRALRVNGEEIGWALEPGTRLDSKAALAAGVNLDAFRTATPPGFGIRKAKK
jgi:hypothetical protein